MTFPIQLSFWKPVSGRHFGLVVLAAAMWGTDPLFRRGLALSLPAATIVFVDHLLPVIVIAPLVVRGLKRAVGTFTGRDWATLGVLGFGSSALATILFTMAFTYGSPTTPVLLQKVQPLVAIAAAAILLGERARPLFGLFVIGGLAGAYLIAFADPATISAPEWQPALLSLGAAALWGLGTVLGRGLAEKVPFGELAGLRLVVGLVAATAIAVSRDEIAPLAHVDGKGVLALLCLALIPGLGSLLVYYRGLRGTPASAATIGELAFPLTTLIIGYTVFHDSLSVTQWLGVAILVATITVLGTVKPQGTPTGVEIAEPVAAARS